MNLLSSLKKIHLINVAIILLGLSGVASAFSRNPKSIPEVVPQIDISRYTGTWYEVGHLPNFFQKFCERSEAQYGQNEDGSISVLNTCFRNEKVFSTINGKAFAPNASEPTKLVVDFGFFRKGDYWILNLDPSNEGPYQWSVVGGPDKDSLFILSRTIPMKQETLDAILLDLKLRGYNTDEIVYDIYK